MTPYKYWTKYELKKQLIRQLEIFKAIKPLHDFVSESISSELWDACLDFDGCSVVQDYNHPCLACFLHDYMWRTGMGGKDADKMFYYLMKLEGCSRGQRTRRYIGVRLGWIFYYKRFHKKKRNVRENSYNMTLILNAIKNYKTLKQF